MISQLPIRYRERVIAVALKPERDLLPTMGDGYVYPQDAYHPYPLYVKGRYNNYGNIDVEDDPKTLDLFGGKDKVQEFILSAARVDKPQPAGFSIQRRGEYCLALIHAGMWILALETVKPNPMWRLDDLHLSSGLLFAPLREEHEAGAFREGLSLEGLTGFSEKEMQVLAALPRQLRPLFKKRAEEVMRVNAFLSMARKMWAPQSGMGGQDHTYSIHRAIAAKVLKFAGKKKDYL